MGFEIVVGAFVTVLIQVLKKIGGRIGSNLTVLLVFVLTIIGAGVFQFGKTFITEDFLKTWGTILGTQYVIWGFFIKYVWPKLGPKEDLPPV